MRVFNHTKYNSRQVKKILTRVYREHVQFEKKIPNLLVTLRQGRGNIGTGRAFLLDKHIIIWLPQPIKIATRIYNIRARGLMSCLGKKSIAHVFAHELLHLVGYKHGCGDLRLRSCYSKRSSVLDEYKWVDDYYVVYEEIK